MKQQLLLAVLAVNLIMPAMAADISKKPAKAGVTLTKKVEAKKAPPSKIKPTPKKIIPK